MERKNYRERVQVVKSILEVPLKLKGPIAKQAFFEASKTSVSQFKTFYRSLVNMGCLIEQKNGSNRYNVTLTEKGLEFHKCLGSLMPFLEEFDTYRKG